MAVTLGAHTLAINTGVTSVTTTGVTTQTSGSTFLVFTPVGDWSDLIDSKGNVYTAKRIQGSGGTAVGYLYECRNGVGGTGHTVQVVFAASGSYAVHFVEVVGAAGVDVVVGDYDAVSSSAYDVTTPSLETSGELLLLFGGANTTGTTSAIAATGSFTVQDKNENGSGYCPSVFATYSPSGQTAVTGGFTCGTMSTTGYSIIVGYTPTLASGGRRQEYLEVSAFGTGLTRTTNFTTTPTAGNLLLTAIAVDKNAGTITVPSGWTQIGTNYSGPSISFALAYKSASGSETGATWNWATTQTGGSACWIAEILGPVAIGGTAQANSADVAVSTQTSGTATANAAAILGLGLFAIDSDTSFFSEANPFPTFSNSFEVERGSSAVVAGWPGLYVARKALSGSGSVETTITSGNTTDQVAAAMVTLDLTGVTAAVTGVFGTSALGSVTVSITAPPVFDGAIFDSNVFDTGDTGTTVNVTGVQATGQVGTVTVNYDRVFAVTGVQATGQVGTVVAAFDQTATVSGNQATGQVGTVTTKFDRVFSVTGVQATGQVGTVTVNYDRVFPITGPSAATGQVGSVTVNYDRIFAVTGVQATGQVGTVTASASSNATATVSGNQATGQVGTVTVNYDRIFPITAPAAATGQVGTATSATAVITTATSNYIAYSTPGSTGWVKGANTTVTGGQQGPDGGYAATRVAMPNDTGTYTRVASSTLTAGVQYTFSIYAKVQSLTNPYIFLQIYDSSQATVQADVQYSATTSWAEYKLSFTPSTTATYYFGLDNQLNSPSTLYTVDAYFWGAYVSAPSPIVGTGQVGSVTVSTSVNATANVTGVQATGQVGSVTVNYDRVFAVTGVQATGQVGTVTVSTASTTTVNVTGVQATGQVGTVTVNYDRVFAVSGVQGTTALGSVTIRADRVFPVTGVQATGQVGTVTTSQASVANVTGVQATGQVGTVTALPVTLATVTGVQATGQVGTVTVTTAASVTANVTGVQGTMSLGSITINYDRIFAVSGVQATTQLGSVTTRYDRIFTVTGVQATGQVGTVTVTTATSVTANVTGVQATGRVGTVTIRADRIFPVTGVQATGQVGSVTASASATTTVTGVQATSQLGAVVVSSATIVYVTGVVGYAQVSQPNVWGPIDTNQIPNWGLIGNLQVPSWADVATANDPAWTNVTTPSTAAWTQIPNG